MTACHYCSKTLEPHFGEFSDVALTGCLHCLNINFVSQSDNGAEVSVVEGARDIREEAPPGSVMAGILSTLTTAIETLPVLPEVPQRILGMIHDPLTSLSDLGEMINEDAALSLKVLKVSNSAYYGGTQEITDLNVACSRLGLKTIAHIMHTVSFREVFRSKNPSIQTFMQEIWHHALASAHCADEIATLVPALVGHTPFVAGLTHNIGKVVLVDLISTKYRGNVGRLRESPELMRKVVARFHHIVGLHAVQYWQMTPEFCASTFLHLFPERCPHEPWAALVNVTAQASAVAQEYANSEEDTPALDLKMTGCFEKLQLGEEQLGTLSRALPERLDKALGDADVL